MYHLSPHWAHVALGSPYFCSDYAQVQEALEAARRRWNKEAGTDDKSAEVIALELKLAELRERLEESERHLMRLSSVYDSLKPLLEKLNSSLNAR